MPPSCQHGTPTGGRATRSLPGGARAPGEPPSDGGDVAATPELPTGPGAAERQTESGVDTQPVPKL
ncbi:hypothetical protein [Streptacidiphilus rugosus]|uniref:hypothetical protein n=1 Tax=Streptacidiphilus rugosus TaxID=405783 RepID=UPI00056A4020|nr:hypothetical protein [Streptacidiphilus rugosus]